MPNINDVLPSGMELAVARLAEQADADHLGMSLYELEPGEEDGLPLPPATRGAPRRARRDARSADD